MPEYMKKVLILLVIGLLLDIGGTVFTGMGAKSDDKEKIQRYNKLAIILFVGSCILLLIVAIVYSTSFTAEQQAENVKYDGYKLQFGEKIKIEETEDLIIDSSSTSANDTTNDDVPSSVQSKVGEAREFSFGFCYGVVCVSIIFLIISIALLVLEHFKPDTDIIAEGEGQEA
jgi:hypothetical protein